MNIFIFTLTVKKIFENNGLSIFVLKKLIRMAACGVFAQRTDTGKQTITNQVHRVLQFEHNAGMTDVLFYAGFQERILDIKRQLIAFLLEAQKKNEKVVGYGAAAKGNTLLNFSGIRPDLLSYVVDRNPAKQGKFLPGSRIPVVSEEQLAIDKPAWVVILPWNLQNEIAEQLAYVRDWGAKFVRAIPALTVF